MGLAQGPPTADQSRQLKNGGRSSPSAFLPRSPSLQVYDILSSRPFLPATPPLRLPLLGQGSPPTRHGTNFGFLNLFQLPRRRGCPWPAPRFSCPPEVIRIVFAPRPAPKKLPGKMPPHPFPELFPPWSLKEGRQKAATEQRKREGDQPVPPRGNPGPTPPQPLR